MDSGFGALGQITSFCHLCSASALSLLSLMHSALAHFDRLGSVGFAE